MKKIGFWALMLVLGVSCSSSTNTDSQTSTGISLQGVVGSGQAALVQPVLYAMPSDCPDNAAGGVSLTATPVDSTLILAPQYVRLLKEGSTTDYFELSACTNATAAEAEANAVTLNTSETTICDADTTLTADDLASYDGIEMAIYYVQMTIPMVIPALSPDVANYGFRLYFNDDTTNGILARDILIYDDTEAKWGWFDYNTNQLAYVEDGRPAGTILDAFANDEYWCADCTANPELCPAEADRRVCSFDNADWSYKSPVTISTRDTSGGTDFSMTGTIAVTAVSDAHTVLMTFDINNTLTAFASTGQITDGDTNIDLTKSCGFHPLFPTVTITESE